MITHVLLMYPTLREKNGVAERCNRTLMDMVRGMMSYSNLPLGLWMEALQKKYTSVMIRVCHSRSRFLSRMYIHDKFMTQSR